LDKGYTVHGTVRDPKDEKKTSHLTSLKGASSHLKLFKAEFDIPNSFDEPFKGCYAVFHVASPYFYQTKDPQKEIIDTAVDGTKSVLSSCEKAGVKVVIFTSSGTAMFMKMAQPGHVFSEEDWSDEGFMRKINAWYPLSKTLSERAFWEWSDKNKGVRCVAVAPSFVSGPPLQSTPNTSNNAIISLVDGSKTTIQNFPVPIADVRDVATAHILVLENEKATGRYLAGAVGTNFLGICNTLRKQFPERSDKIPSQVELREGEQVRPPMVINNEKIRSLGLTFRDTDLSLKETVDEALKKGFLN